MKKPVAVFGLGISNLAVIKTLIGRGDKIIAWDDNEPAREKAKALGAEIRELNFQTLSNCELLILAPGVPFHFPKPHPVVDAARRAGLEIICDIELLYRFGIPCKTIGITGTNGKSTTTALIGHVLKQAGKDAVIGGNIGKAVFDLDLPGKDGFLVLELSSYQIDICPTFRPDIAVLINITPDHIDRHGTMSNYAAAKEALFEGKGVAIINKEDEYTKAIASRVKEKHQRILIPVTSEKIAETKRLRGAHNIQNMKIAYTVCKDLGLDHNAIIKGFESFEGLPHRQFLVRTIGQTDYINDSKATNAEATSKALSSFDNIYWIAGGQPKEGGLEGTENLLTHVKKTFLIGEAANDFAAFLKSNKAEYEICCTMDKAVTAAHAAAQKDQNKSVVLLSPACASFDQYKNFEERGNHFTKLVEALS